MKTNEGLSSEQIRTILDYTTMANDEQVKALRGVLEGEVKKRALRGSQ